MRALVWEGPRTMEMRSIDKPRPGPEDVLIEVAYSGICGSELGGYLGHNSLRVPPLIMGHEFSGVIVERGADVPKNALSTGTRVTVNPIIPGPGSRAAAVGRQNLSRNRQILGIHRPGSFAEYVVAPAANTYPLPNSLDLEMAALAEPMACAIRAAQLASAGPSDTALVTGLGPIGLLVAVVLRESGLRNVIATDLSVDRRRIGESFGLKVLDPADGNIPDVVHEVTHGVGADVAIDAVGADTTRQECINAVRWGGKVVLVGLHAEESMLRANYVIRSEITIQGSFAYTNLDFENALQWLADRRAQVQKWIEHAPLSEGGKCFERLLADPGPIVKILLDSQSERD